MGGSGEDAEPTDPGESKVGPGAGSVVYVPRTTVHAFTNTGAQKGKILFINTRRAAGAVPARVW